MEIFISDYDKIVNKNFLLYLSHFHLLHHFIELLNSLNSKELSKKLNEDLLLYFPYFYAPLKETFSLAYSEKPSNEFFLPIRCRESDTFEQCASLISESKSISKKIILISKKEKHFLWKTILRRDGGIPLKNVMFLTKKSFSQILLSLCDLRQKEEDPLDIKNKTFIFCEFFTNREIQSRKLLREWRSYFLEKKCTLFYIDEIEFFLSFKKDLPNLSEEQFFIKFGKSFLNSMREVTFPRVKIIFPKVNCESSSNEEVKFFTYFLKPEENGYVVLANRRSVLPLQKTVKNIKFLYYEEWYLKFLFDFSIHEESDFSSREGSDFSSRERGEIFLFISPLLWKKTFFHIKSE